MAKTKEVLHQEGNATGGISSAITIAKEKGQMKYLDPKVDLIFKKIFSKHPDLLMSLLNALLPLSDDEQIQSIKYLPTELVPELYEHKNSIVDVLCEDVKGRKFCVEMQMEWSNAFQQRVERIDNKCNSDNQCQPLLDNLYAYRKQDDSTNHDYRRNNKHPHWIVYCLLRRHYSPKLINRTDNQHRGKQI